MKRMPLRLTIMLALLALLWLGLSEYGLHTYQQAQLYQQQRQLTEEGNRLRLFLESEIQQAAFLAGGIESYVIARRGDIDEQDIDAILEVMFARGTYFRNLGIAPDNVIRWVYPLAGNEQALGLRYQDNPQQWPAVEAVMRSGQGALAGPIALVQGGNGLIYRSPISISGQYWGQMSTVLDSDALLAALDAVNTARLPLALRGTHGLGAEGTVFYGDAELFEGRATLLPVRIPGGEWQLALTHNQSGLPTWGLRALIMALGLLVGGLSYALVRLWWQGNLMQWLDAQVQERTQALQSNNQLLQGVMNASRSLAIIATDDKGFIQLYNQGACELLGHEHDWQGLHFSQLLATQSAKVIQRLPRCLQQPSSDQCHLWLGNEPCLELLLHSAHQDSAIAVELTFSPLTIHQQPGFVLLASDIRERKRLEQLKTDFIATINHELRTPLTAIKGALSLLGAAQLGTLNAQQQRLLEMAQNNGHRLGLLINDFLDMEKLLAGQMPMHLTRHRLSTLLTQAVSDHQGYAERFQVRLNLVTPGVDHWLMVDERRWQQVMANLLSNACKFSAPGGQVNIRARQQRQWLLIDVEDYGQGIPLAFQRAIFSKFAQADSGNTRNSEGTGLGLAISKELAERMHGQLSFESTPGKGSCFTFQLPLSLESRDEP